MTELCPSLPHPFSLLIMNARDFLDGSINPDLIAVIQARSIVYTPPIRLISRKFFETEALNKSTDTPPRGEVPPKIPGK